MLQDRGREDRTIQSFAAPAISDYAIIGDCRTAALVSRHGSIDWLCLPNFNSPSVFAGLLDPHAGGCFRISPRNLKGLERRYLPDTNVLETTFTTAEGELQIVDFLTISEETPQALNPDREVLRVVRTTSGSPSAEIVFQPRPNYAFGAPKLDQRGEMAWSCCHGRDALVLCAEVPLRLDRALYAVVGDIRLAAGETCRVSLSYTHGNPLVYPGMGPEADSRFEATVRWWRNWCGRCAYDGPYRDAVTRGILTLKLLNYALSGAVIAAPTASLPETIGGSRNWDYRYCWLRDASLTLNAFVELGYMDEGKAFVDWLMHSTRLTAPHLQVMYDIHGNTRISERILNHLSGYRGSRPVRVGNGATGQLQLDVYGSVTLAAYDFVQRGGELDSTEKSLLAGFGRVVEANWQKPDEGIWEYRDGRRHNTYSKVMCWAVLDRLIRLHDGNALKIPRERFAEVRDAIQDSIECHGFNEDLGSYVSDYGGETVDASLLLMARCRYVAADSARMRGTHDCLRQQIGTHGLLYRYPTGWDGMAEPEGAFAACSFWEAEYLARRGDIGEARGTVDHLLGYANDVGLFPEELDPRTGEALGNFPQAFSHSGLINAALAIRAAEQVKGEGACA